jgi:hypothetical protein
MQEVPDYGRGGLLNPADSAQVILVAMTSGLQPPGPWLEFLLPRGVTVSCKAVRCHNHKHQSLPLVGENADGRAQLPDIQG